MTLSDHGGERGFGSIAQRAADIADRTGMADLAARFRATAAEGDPGMPRVVCVGQIKAGKSSTVNALIGRPLLSPVGDDVVTATYVVFMWGEDERAVVIMMDPQSGSARRVPVGLNELADYVSVDAIHEGVVGAEVYLNVPLLREMHILDTPGVGGLTRGHSAITMSTLDTAHALLFLMDAGSPLSRPEIQFLGDALEHNDAVVLAMTKTDLHSDWEVIATDNRELIARHLPQLTGAPIVSISSRLADEASRLAFASSDAAAQLRELSGMDCLINELRTTVAVRSAALSLTNRVQTLNALLVELRTRLTERPENLAGDPARLRVMLAERDRLKSFLSDPHTGALQVRRRIMRLQRDAERDFSYKASALIQRYKTSIDTSPGGQLKQIPSLLRGELARLVIDSIEEADHELSDILYELEEQIGSVAAVDSLRGMLAEDVQVDLSDHEEAADWGRHVVAAGTGAVSSAFVVGALLLASAPAAIAIGAAAIATAGLKELLDSRTTSRQQSLRLWLDRVEQDVDASFDGALGGRLRELERVLNAELPRLVEERVRSIDRFSSLSGSLTADRSGDDLADVDDLASRLAPLLVPADRS